MCLSEVVDLSLGNLDSVCASSSLAFCMVYSAYKLNKQGDNAALSSFLNLEPVHCSMSSSNCCFLTCIQVSQESSKVVWYSHLFKNLQFVAIHKVKNSRPLDSKNTHFSV